MKNFRRRRSFSAVQAAAALTVLAAAVLFFSGCAEEEKSFLSDTYADWTRINREELDYPVPGHESNYRIIYMNETGTGAGGYPFPAGTVIIKEIFEGLDPEEGAAPVMLTAMVKAPDHDAARGGWLWIVKDLSSDNERIIREEFCLTCHDNANEEHPYADGNPSGEFRDYVYFVPGYAE